MSAGESLARFVGAVTLLALFAPPVETPDPAKRKFGEAGVAACSQLIDGEKREGNVIRRLPLLLGRANHRIEAKDYKGAVADVALAREEARAAGLAGDPYFDRSLGISFDMIEAEARLRDGDVQGAREVSLRRVKSYRHSYFALIAAEDYRPYARELDSLGLERAVTLARIAPPALAVAAEHLEEEGKFAEAARYRESWAALIDTLGDNPGSLPTALAALTQALAGNWDAAETLASRARTRLKENAANGKPERNASATVEALDLYAIAKLVKGGDVAMARRNFAARSEWLTPSFGQIVAVNVLLRANAPASELTGPLAKTPEMMWTERRDQDLATKLERDKNNRTLWGRILPYASATSYEQLSRPVWNGAKSNYIGKTKNEKLDAFVIGVPGATPLTRVDAMLLHCAVTAKARGLEGFTFMMVPDTLLGLVRFGNPGDPGIVEDLYLNADAVIAELKDVIPTPAEVQVRKKAREQQAKKVASAS